MTGQGAVAVEGAVVAVMVGRGGDNFAANNTSADGGGYQDDDNLAGRSS